MKKWKAAVSSTSAYASKKDFIIEDSVDQGTTTCREGSPASVLDLFYHFRLWANYTGVRSILKLTDGGYVGFLMKNLGTLVFFAGALAELSTIHTLGEMQYLTMLRRFQRDYIDRNERFSRTKYLVPLYVRLRSYKHLGIINRSIEFILPDIEDPIQFLKI